MQLFLEEYNLDMCFVLAASYTLSVVLLLQIGTAVGKRISKYFEICKVGTGVQHDCMNFYISWFPGIYPPRHPGEGENMSL